MLIEYVDLVSRLATFRLEIAKALAESDLEMLTVRRILVKKGITTEEEMKQIEVEIRRKRFARLEKENLIRIQVVHENRE
jgi:hypothetical protein